MPTRESEPMVIKDYGKSTTVTPIIGKYGNGNLCVSLETADTHEYYGSITLNLTELPANQAAIDMENHPGAPDFIEKYELGHDTGKRLHHWFSEYLVYEFDMDKLKTATK